MHLSLCSLSVDLNAAVEDRYLHHSPDAFLLTGCEVAGSNFSQKLLRKDGKEEPRNILLAQNP